MRVREIVAVVVATDSPLGREEPTIGQFSAHLPAADAEDCPLCGEIRWPCPTFRKIADTLHEAGVPVLSLVPESLQARLRQPNPKPPPPVPHSGHQTGLRQEYGTHPAADSSFCTHDVPRATSARRK